MTALYSVCLEYIAPGVICFVRVPCIGPSLLASDIDLDLGVCHVCVGCPLRARLAGQEVIVTSWDWGVLVPRSARCLLVLP
jgi:hypothetical protein